MKMAIAPTNFIWCTLQHNHRAYDGKTQTFVLLLL